MFANMHRGCVKLLLSTFTAPSIKHCSSPLPPKQPVHNLPPPSAAPSPPSTTRLHTCLQQLLAHLWPQLNAVCFTLLIVVLNCIHPLPKTRIAPPPK